MLSRVVTFASGYINCFLRPFDSIASPSSPSSSSSKITMGMERKIPIQDMRSKADEIIVTSDAVQNDLRDAIHSIQVAMAHAKNISEYVKEHRDDLKMRGILHKRYDMNRLKDAAYGINSILSALNVTDSDSSGYDGSPQSSNCLLVTSKNNDVILDIDVKDADVSLEYEDERQEAIEIKGELTSGDVEKCLEENDKPVKMKMRESQLKLKELQPDVPCGQKVVAHFLYASSPTEFYLNLDYDASTAVGCAVLLKAASFKENDIKMNPDDITYGALCLARYTDKCFYRAEIQGVRIDEVKVYFIDWGNTIHVSKDDLLPMDESLLKFKVQAVKCSLKGWDKIEKTQLNYNKRICDNLNYTSRIEVVFHEKQDDDEDDENEDGVSSAPAFMETIKRYEVEVEIELKDGRMRSLVEELIFTSVW